MIIRKMFKLFLSSIFLLLFNINQSFANNGFNEWLKNFKLKAINTGVSEKVVNVNQLILLYVKMTQRLGAQGF